MYNDSNDMYIICYNEAYLWKNNIYIIAVWL